MQNDRGRRDVQVILLIRWRPDLDPALSEGANAESGRSRVESELELLAVGDGGVGEAARVGASGVMPNRSLRVKSQTDCALTAVVLFLPWHAGQQVPLSLLS